MSSEKQDASSAASKSMLDDAEGLGSNFRDTPWVPPSRDVAFQHLELNTFEGGKAHCCVGTSALGGLGEGISLYFMMLKFFTIYFFIASVLAVPHMLIARGGGTVVPQYVDPLKLVTMSAVNHADPGLVYSTGGGGGGGGGTDGGETLYCRATYKGLDTMTCDALHALVVEGTLKTELPGIDLDGSYIPFETVSVAVSLAKLDCDLGCACGFDLSAEGFTSCGAYLSSDPSYSDDDESPYSNLCPVDSVRLCGDEQVACGDYVLQHGRAAADELLAADEGWDYCAAEEITCGKYEPTVENLGFFIEPFLNVTITRDDAAGLIAACDIVYSILFMLLWKIIERKVNVLIEEVDDNNVTPGDYTIFVKGLPKDADEEEIRAFFSDLYVLDNPDWSFKGWLCGCWGRKNPRTPDEIVGYDGKVAICEPVENVDLHGKKNYIGSWVADVNVAHPNGDLIRRCQAMKKYSNLLLEARALVKKYSPGSPLKGTHPRKLKAAEVRLRDVEKKIEKIHYSLQSSAKYLTQQDKECMAAFVTFENEDSYNRCVEDFARYGCARWYLPQTWFSPPFPPNLKFRGKKNLLVEKAPEPSNILWENLETSFAMKRLRKTLTSFITFCMLLISFAIILTVQSSKSSLAEKIPDLAKCVDGLPQVYAFQPADTSYEWYSNFDDLCDAGEFFLTVEGFHGITASSSVEEAQFLVDNYAGDCQDPCVSDTNEMLTCVGYAGNNFTDDTEFYRLRDVEVGSFVQYLKYQECPDPAEVVQEGTASWSIEGCPAGEEFVNANGKKGDEVVIDSNSYCAGSFSPNINFTHTESTMNCERFDKTTIKGCFCIDAIVSSIKEDGIISGTKKIIDDYGDLCGSFAEQFGLAQTLVIGSAAVVAIVNLILQTSIRGMAGFERHNSLSGMAKAVSVQVAITLFVNTAVIVVVVNAAYKFRVLNALGLLKGQSPDFDFKWYTNVGAAICTTMLINSFTPHIGFLVYWFVAPIQRLFKRGGGTTQKQLNQSIEGPEFLITTKFPMLINTLNVTLVFSSALPVLLPIGFIATFLFYNVDKFLLLRYYKKPPNYDATIAKGVVKIFPFILLVHLAFSCWVYSQKTIFQSSCVPFIDNYKHFLSYVVKYDTVGFIPRLLRRNVFPVFLIFILFLVLTVYNFLGHWIVKAVLKGTVGRILGIVFLPFFKIWSAVRGRCCCCKPSADFGEKEYNPPYTKTFIRGYPKGKSAPELSAAAGWVKGKSDDSGCEFHTKEWLGAGKIDGVKHNAGELKRTWEAIRDSQLYCYNINKNELYLDAMVAKESLMSALNAGGGSPPPKTGAKMTQVVPVA